MNLHDLGRRPLRLLLLPLAALLLAAVAAPARADYVNFSANVSDGRYHWVEAGDTVDLNAKFALIPEAPYHVKGGSSFALQATGVPAGATVGSPQMNVLNPWPDPFDVNARSRTETSVRLMAPNVLGENHFAINWVPTGVQCALAGSSCMRSMAPVTYTLRVMPRAVTNLAVTETANGARVTFTPSVDDYRIAGYTAHRYEKSSGNYRAWSSLPRGTASIVDEDGTLKPGTEYCWSIGVYYRHPTSGQTTGGYATEECMTTNAAPTKPGAVTGPAVDSDGDFDVSWAESTDAEGDPFRYELQTQDANDAGWRTLGSNLTATSYEARGFAAGTHSFRVRAVGPDARRSSDWNEAGTPVKVDKTAPSAPRGSTRPFDHDGWFKDQVTVSWTGSTDPALPDGSPGSGVIYPADETFSTHGDHHARGRARDAAGNESTESVHSVHVDARAPRMTLDCPTGPVQAGDAETVGWHATDEGVGLYVPAAGSLPLDTSSRGERSVESPVVADGVGHVSDVARCTYIVKARPTRPGAPAGPEFDQDGSFDLSWSGSTDDDGDPFSYQVIGRRGVENYAFLGFGIEAPSFTTDKLAEGTWGFAVRAAESSTVASAFAIRENVTKVDRTAPSAPAATTDPAAPGEEADGWFKDAVIVSFGGSTDPNLADGTTGSGVAGYTGAKTFVTTGEHAATGTAADRAGNRSGEVSRSVKVDATAPTVQIECPAGPLAVGSAHSATWRAADEGSGLSTAADGSEVLDTSTPGRKTVTAPAPRDKVGHEGAADSCDYEVNSAPTKPGGPAGPELDQDGTFDLTWAASDDADGDAVTYAVEQRESGDTAEWKPLADGLTATELRVTDAAEGTYDYRVRAFDPHGGVSDWAEASDVVKVDGTGPSAPVATTDPAAPAEGAAGWFKNAVTVSFGGSADPGLRDGSAGSGVARYSDAKTFDASGEHSASGRATDRAGNSSAAATAGVKVDATAPSADIDGCPTEPLLERTRKAISWSAADAHSGLTTGDSGEITLDTSTPGDNRVAHVTARDRVGHETTVRCEFDVYANSAPSAPGAPQGPSIDQDGEFALTWAAAGDRDTGAGDSFTYELQRQDADDADWTTVAGDLTQARRDVAVENGTWKFRVRAVDGFGAASDWVASAPVKVDSVKPTAPKAITDPAAAQNGWFKNRVTVSFAGSQDPALRDSSDGSGIVSHTAPRSFDTTGEHLAEGTATDRAGNVSDEARTTVRVDADPPAVAITCPTAPVIVGQTAKATWTATDRGSGLTTPGSGAVTLDTSSPGDRAATAPAALDAAGHETKGVSCSYEVAYKFAGFNAPINGSVVNAGKAGRTYPVKWRLQRFDGSHISDPAALALLPSMSVATKPTDCSAFGALPEDDLEESTVADPALKYDAADDQYHYNYKTPSTPGCYLLVVRNADGNSTRWVNFKLTR